MMHLPVFDETELVHNWDFHMNRNSLNHSNQGFFKLNSNIM